MQFHAALVVVHGASDNDRTSNTLIARAACEPNALGFAHFKGPKVQQSSQLADESAG